MAEKDRVDPFYRRTLRRPLAPGTFRWIAVAVLALGLVLACASLGAMSKVNPWMASKVVALAIPLAVGAWVAGRASA